MFHKHGGDIYSCLPSQNSGEAECGELSENTYNKIRDFSVNINYRGMPEAVRLAAERAVKESVHYPDPEYRILRAAIVKRENARVSNPITQEQIICGNGAAELMFALAAAYRPKKALLAVPSFFEYEQALSSFGCEIKHFYMQEEQNFRLEEIFLGAIDETIDCIILGNPNNPTGQMIETELIHALTDLCQRLGILLVLDESFFDFLSETDQAKTFSGVQEIQDNHRLFIIKSFTKMFGMPGLRFGYGICSDNLLIEKTRGIMQPWNVSVPAQEAARQAALEIDFERETACQNEKNRMQMKTWMEQAGYRVYPSNTNFLLFQGPEYLKSFCFKQGFLIRDCSNFRGLFDGFFRICIRSEAENAELMEVLREAKSVAFENRL